MRNLYLSLLASTLFFTACQKITEHKQLTGETIATVRAIDAMCSSVIFEIQEDSLKKYGEQNFTYKGKNTMACFQASYFVLNLQIRISILTMKEVLNPAPLKY